MAIKDKYVEIKDENGQNYYVVNPEVTIEQYKAKYGKVFKDGSSFAIFFQNNAFEFLESQGRIDKSKTICLKDYPQVEELIERKKALWKTYAVQKGYYNGCYLFLLCINPDEDLDN